MMLGNWTVLGFLAAVHVSPSGGDFLSGGSMSTLLGVEFISLEFISAISVRLDRCR